MDAFRCSTRGGGSFTRREMDSCVLLLPSSLPITEPNVPSRHLFPLFTEFLRANTYELSAGDALSTIANVQRSPRPRRRIRRRIFGKWTTERRTEGFASRKADNIFHVAENGRVARQDLPSPSLERTKLL